MKFPVSWLAVAGLLSTLLILGYARLHAQPPKAQTRPAPPPSLIITSSSEDVLRRVKAAIKDIQGDRHYLTENRMVNNKLTRSSTKIGLNDVAMIDRAVKGDVSKSAVNTVVHVNTLVMGGKSLEKVQAALQGVDARLFQARLVDSKALMSGQLVSRGLLLPAKTPAAAPKTVAPKQGH